MEYTILSDTIIISDYHTFLKECHYNGYTFEVYYNFLTNKIDIVCVNLKLWQNDISLKEYRNNYRGLRLIKLILFYFGLFISNSYDDDFIDCFEDDEI
ncbi:MAG: hypothetical protein II013_07165 [Lachnobacterium sp.]|nr:hypothetical protein [Lachnobacterium sp.]